MYCNKNIVGFLLFHVDIGFYFKTKCCVKFFIERNAVKFYTEKYADMCYM